MIKLQFYVSETVFRFCSQPFKIDDFHESIHLCNNAIQTKYKNGDRSSNLPEENMWDNDTFINYLRQVQIQITNINTHIVLKKYLVDRYYLRYVYIYIILII